MKPTTDAIFRHAGLVIKKRGGRNLLVEDFTGDNDNRFALDEVTTRELAFMLTHTVKVWDNEDSNNETQMD